MSFPSDGRNHKNALEYERTMYLYKSHFENFYNKEIDNIEHVGGTKTVVDFKINFIDGSYVSKSLKKKTSLKNGSFDYINTSDFDKSLISKSYDIYKKYKGLKNKLAKDFLIMSISDDLVNMKSEDITNIIKKIIEKYRKIGGLDLLETSTNKVFINVVPPFFKIIEEGGFLSVNNSGKKSMSYKLDIYDKDGKLQNDLGLRIRLHLNNGWTKWYNGESSSIVIKIQQDKVLKLIKE